MTRQHVPKGGNGNAGDSLKGPIDFFKKSHQHCLFNGYLILRCSRPLKRTEKLLFAMLKIGTNHSRIIM